MKKLLWVGDANCPSGFARCTHAVLDVLRHVYDVSVIGINHTGDPHSYPYPIYPASRSHRGEDTFGVRRFGALVKSIKPDLAVILQDPWNIPAYMKVAGDVPVIGWLAVDGKNCLGSSLEKLQLAIFWTRFALDEAFAGGYGGPAAVVPLGVDLEIYRELDRAEARTSDRIGLPDHMKNAFIVGVVGRNQVRKRLDLTISYFADWVNSQKIRDAYLFMHVCPTGDQGYDLRQLIRYHGLTGRVILSDPSVDEELNEQVLPWIYSCFDAQLTTTQGEGWGLCTMEGMACGVPQIVPDWSALGEWTDGAVIKIPCTTFAATHGNINSIGGIADRKLTIQALDHLYGSKVSRERLRHRGLSVVQRPEYRWPAIGQKFADTLEELFTPEVVTEKVLEVV